MKRVFILFLLTAISFLNASLLINVYHRDYGVIDRTVLVFDTKPHYEILEHKSSIQINLQECCKNTSLQKLDITNNRVLTGYNYQLSEDKTIVSIDINASHFLESGDKYIVNIMELQEDVFKLVLDIFISTNPKNLFELTSYASFYETTGYFNLAEEYNHLVVELQNKIKEEEKKSLIQSTQVVASQKQSKVTDKIQSTIQKLSTKYNIKISELALYLLVVLIVIILIIILSRKKLSKLNLNEKIVRSTDGFADDTYMKEVAKKLTAKGWKIKEIAKELEITFEEAQRFIAPDLEQEQEHL